MGGRVGVFSMKLQTPLPLFRKPCLPFPFQKNNSAYPIRRHCCTGLVWKYYFAMMNRVDVGKTPPPSPTWNSQHSLIVSIFIFHCTHKKIHLASNRCSLHFSQVNSRSRDFYFKRYSTLSLSLSKVKDYKYCESESCKRFLSV